MGKKLLQNKKSKKTLQKLQNKKNKNNKTTKKVQVLSPDKNESQRTKNTTHASRKINRRKPSPHPLYADEHVSKKKQNISKLDDLFELAEKGDIDPDHFVDYNFNSKETKRNDKNIPMEKHFREKKWTVQNKNRLRVPRRLRKSKMNYDPQMQKFDHPQRHKVDLYHAAMNPYGDRPVYSSVDRPVHSFVHRPSYYQESLYDPLLGLLESLGSLGSVESLRSPSMFERPMLERRTPLMYDIDPFDVESHSMSMGVPEERLQRRNQRTTKNMNNTKNNNKNKNDLKTLQRPQVTIEHRPIIIDGKQVGVFDRKKQQGPGFYSDSQMMNIHRKFP